jgi:hypothetical protein
MLRKTLSVNQLRRNSIERRRLAQMATNDANTEDYEEQGNQGANADEDDQIVAPPSPDAPPSPVIAPLIQVVAPIVPIQDTFVHAAIDPHQLHRPTREEMLAAATAFSRSFTIYTFTTR